MGSFPSIFYLIFLTIPSGREDRYCYLQMTDEGLIAQVPVNPSQGFTTTKWLGLAQGLCCSFRKETVGSGKRMWRSVGRGSCWRGAVVPCTAYPLCVRWSKMLTPCRGFLPLSLTTEVSHIFFCGRDDAPGSCMGILQKVHIFKGKEVPVCVFSLYSGVPLLSL